MVIFRNYSSGLLKSLLGVCMLISLCALLLTWKVYYVAFSSNVSVKDFIVEQFCLTTSQFPYLIIHGAMRNNSFDGLLKVRERWKC